MPVPHRSTGPARPRHRREVHLAQWSISIQVPFVTALDRLIFASLLALFMMALGSVVTNQVVCSGRLGGCDYVDIKRIRTWDRACLGATLAAFVGMHLDILRRVRAFTSA